MNAKLAEVLAATLEKATAATGELVDATKAGFNKAVDFASEQIPDVIHQLMVWEFSYHAFWAVFYIVLIITLMSIGVWCWKRSNTHKQGSDANQLLKVPFWVALVASLLIGGNGLMQETLVCAKVTFAPKVFLIEYCGDLLSVKKHNSDLKQGETPWVHPHNH